MPSTVVHVGLAGLIGVALLGRHFDTKAIVVVVGVCALLDLDTLVGIYRKHSESASRLDPEGESRKYDSNMLRAVDVPFHSPTAHFPCRPT